MHPLHAAASARDKEVTKKSANGGTKADFGAI
jgi:hypothetical protein